MNVVIFGAGASFATHRLPLTATALKEWQEAIEREHAILALALDWAVRGWRRGNVTLEDAWQAIDLAWKERGLLGVTPKVTPLDLAQRRQVWELAEAEQRRERGEPCYYRRQMEWARRAQWSTEQFLSIAGGWEFRRLIQQYLSIPTDAAKCAPYRNLLEQAGPIGSILSFNYDTLVEQFLDADGIAWTYDVPSGAGKVSVLKPHGSVNWTHTHVFEGQTDEIGQDDRLRPENMGYQGSRFIQNLVVGLREKTEHTWAEPADAIREHFQRILDACEAALREAQRVFVVGYSFPEPDTTFLDVVAKACASRADRSLSVVVIDRARPWGSWRQRARLREFLGPTARIDYCPHGFEAWGRRHACANMTRG